MIKRNIVLLLFMSFAVTAYAAEDRIDVAKVENNLPFQKKYSLVAPKVSERYEYYEVRGKNEKELRAQMTQNGCSWKDGKKYDSVTTWNVTWEYDHDRTPSSCSAESFRANVEVTFRFPEWVPNDDAPQSLVDRWNKYMQSLIDHENGHRDLVVGAAYELSLAVAKLPAAPTCSELDRAIRVLCSEYMLDMNTDQKAYDGATNHGARQGALFP